jgi:alkanesulfonate monooxygenase SsuD/methylene tetrahydromethanopterin reductase-like flavin-dependent oxidoreductase (luciferase family)
LLEVEMMDVGSPPPGLAIQGGTVPLVVEAGIAAERNNLPSVWTSEFYERSAVVTLAALAGATSRIALGSSIAWITGRTPLTLAMDFRSLDDLCPGRLSMGIGTGNPVVIADWHGVTEPHPVPRVVEAVRLVRQIWNLHERPVAHDGRFYRCHMPQDPLLPPLSKGALPVLMAAGGLPMIRAAGTVADGLVGLPLSTGRYVTEVVRPALAEGARRAGRTGPVPITGMIICSISDDPVRSRATAATQIAIYATRRSTDAVLDLHGFGAEAAQIRAAFARGDLAGMRAAVSDRMLDELAVYGTPGEARDRYRARFAGLYEQPLLFASGKGRPAEDLRDELDAICETFAKAEEEAR